MSSRIYVSTGVGPYVSRLMARWRRRAVARHESPLLSIFFLTSPRPHDWEPFVKDPRYRRGIIYVPNGRIDGKTSVGGAPSRCSLDYRDDVRDVSHLLLTAREASTQDWDLQAHESRSTVGSSNRSSTSSFSSLPLLLSHPSSPPSPPPPPPPPSPPASSSPPLILEKKEKQQVVVVAVVVVVIVVVVVVVIVVVVVVVIEEKEEEEEEGEEDDNDDDDDDDEEEEEEEEDRGKKVERWYGVWRLETGD
uniref:Uncharacterized protein n=1 Tax=Vespula pensylvanica TaxID=30213 RepID=A0A834KM40_VESPE|nr:hypothetical protein H0235_013924 [Vespula pensylvanica]